MEPSPQINLRRASDSIPPPQSKMRKHEAHEKENDPKKYQKVDELGKKVLNKNA